MNGRKVSKREETLVYNFSSGAKTKLTLLRFRDSLDICKANAAFLSSGAHRHKDQIN